MDASSQVIDLGSSLPLEPATGGAPTIFGYIVVAVVLVGIALGLNFIRGAIAKSSWSLSDALSEGVETMLRKPDGTPMLNAAGDKSITGTERKASSSRFIALIGLVAMLLLYIGFGAVVLNQFAAHGTVPDGTSAVGTFLLTGLSLFAPYAVNKIGGMFSTGG